LVVRKKFLGRSVRRAIVERLMVNKWGARQRALFFSGASSPFAIGRGQCPIGFPENGRGGQPLERPAKGAAATQQKFFCCSFFADRLDLKTL
jgi:hypothetical protein